MKKNSNKTKPYQCDRCLLVDSEKCPDSQSTEKEWAVRLAELFL